MSFYVTLPSNQDITQQAGEFRCILHETLVLTQPFEVALVEIIYPNSWDTLQSGRNRIILSMENDTLVEFRVPHDRYSRVEDLISSINQTLADVGVHFKYRKTIHKVECEKQPKVLKLHLSDLLQYMLGFGESTLTDKKTRAKYSPDLRGGIDCLYIYTDIIDYQIVGPTKVPLLRAIATKGSYGELIDEMFHTPYYLPVLRNHIDTIRISIKDDTGSTIPFNFGKTIVKLHFRPKE